MAGVLASVVRRIGESRKFVALMPTVTGSGRRRPVFGLSLLLLCLLGMEAVAPARLQAQTYQSIPPLSFTSTLNSTSAPLPQIINLVSPGSLVDIVVSATTTTGGNWLSVAFTGVSSPCCGPSTPNSLIVSANPSVTLAAGTYTGQILLTQNGGSATLTIPVTLTVEPATATYFDELPGGLSFFMQTGLAGPQSQPLPIRNAGAGTLNWTSTISTADGGNWLSLSAPDGTAPATPNVLINPANLPNGGRVPGVYTGQVLLQTAGDSVSVPVAVTVGSVILGQTNPLSFTKTVFTASNPLSQQVNIFNTGGSVNTAVQVFNGTGGSWLSAQYGVAYNGNPTPVPLTVAVNPNINLAVGTYTAEIVITGGKDVEIIPVTLVIQPASATFFDALPGELTFSMVTGGSAPPVQPLPIRNAGSGTLPWSASTTTSDGGNWLTLSAAGGTAPSTPAVGIIPANLPNGGLLAGTFTGQVVLQGSGSTVTVPVTVTVGSNVFNQINGLNFTKTAESASNPLSQVITVATTVGSIPFTATAVEGTGGSWLTVAYDRGCCAYNTPLTLTVSVNPAVSLAAGTYTAEILIQGTSSGNQAEVVPVTLTIEPNTAAYFDELPGQLAFSMQTAGAAPPSELVQIRNAGSGTLNFNASASTADGGSWLVLSANSGTAPYLLSVSINPAALPNAGLIAGTFVGQVVLTTSGDTVTIPVTVTVGDSVLRQISPLNFSKTVNSTNNPLPQVITLASTDVDFGAFTISATEVDGTGGSWLTIQLGAGCCGYSTPLTLTATVNPAVTLAAGTYTAEIIIQAGSGAQSEVVPVTLTVQPVSVAAFDTLGALTFSGQATGGPLVSQPLPIRNSGPGLLSWVASVSTADGGNWLTLDSTSGVAPATPNVSINPANLPNQGRVPGTFVGEIMLQAASGIVTVPVTVTLGDSVFQQLPALAFSMPYQGAIPATQSLPLASTDAAIRLYASTTTSSGGNWLSITNYDCCPYTPVAFTIGASPASPLAPGVYTGSIYVTALSGTEESVVPVSLTVTSTTPTATPTFTPPGATYTTAQSVSINDATTDAAIYYTTDGSTPTTSSTRYTGPVQVAASETLQAIAIAPGFAQSAVGAAAYVINYGITVNPASYAFPNTVVGSTTMSSTLTLQNASSTTLTGISFSIAGANAVSFALPSGAMGCGATLAAGASCSFAVSFTPTLNGTLSAFVSISDSSPGSPQTVALSGTGDPNTPTTVLFDGIGSSGLYLALGQAASAATTASPAGLGATCLWTTNKLGVVVATDSSVNGGGKTDTGSAWVAWTPVGGSCSTTNATTVVYAYLAADSVVANRCLFNGCTVKYGGSGTASAGLINAAGEVPLAAGVAAALNGAGGNGLGVTAAGTDIRPEDAEFATARALTPCGAAVSPGSQYLGLGYTNGSAIKSYYSGMAFNVINFALPSAYTVTPIGASPLVVLVNGVAGGNGFSDPAITNLTSGALALFLDGTFAQTQDALTAPSTGATEPITVLLREPLSGAYNLMEYGVVNTQSLKSSQDVGLTQQASEMNCTGTAVKSNPFTLPSGAGFRRRALSTAEELYEVSFRANALGYAFWSAENFKTLTPAAAPYTKYLTIDGVDPLQTTYTGGAVPTTPAQLANVTLANVANGSYPIWSVLRLVNIGASASTPVTSLAVAAQNFANTSAQPDFVPYNNLYAVHSHFIPPAGTGYPATALNGTARACGPKEAGGDVGGVVLTKAGDYDYCYDFGLTSGRTGLRR